MAKYKLEIKETVTLYQLKEIIKLLVELLAKDIEIDEIKIKDSIKKHFKKV